MKECTLWTHDSVDCPILETINIRVYVSWHFISTIGFVYTGNEPFLTRFACCISFMTSILHVVTLLKEKCVIKYLSMWTLIENFKFLIRHFVYTDMVHKGHSCCHILLWWSVDTFLRRCHTAMDKHIRAEMSPLCHCIGHTRKTVHSLQSLGKPVRDSAHSSHL